MTEPIKLKWGETPWDDLSREDLLREVQRMYSAIRSALPALKRATERDPLDGTAEEARRKMEWIETGLQSWDRETVYRAFFRYTDPLLFPGLGLEGGQVWVTCDRCLSVVLGWSSPGRECPLCRRNAELAVPPLMRALTWDDMKPKAVAETTG